MKVNEVISKLRVMLGAETEQVSKIKSSFAEATLVDGTIITTEGEFAPGAIAYVKVEEGDAPFAPEGMHETQDGLLVTVGMDGEIISIEEKSAEAPAEAPVAEEAMEEIAEEDVEAAAPIDAEALVSAIAELIQPQAEELKALKEQLSKLTERFNSIADEPAATKVKNTFSSEASEARSIAERRLERLIQLRKQK